LDDLRISFFCVPFLFFRATENREDLDLTLMRDIDSNVLGCLGGFISSVDHLVRSVIPALLHLVQLFISARRRKYFLYYLPAFSFFEQKEKIAKF